MWTEDRVTHICIPVLFQITGSVEDGSIQVEDEEFYYGGCRSVRREGCCENVILCRFGGGDRRRDLDLDCSR
jgi:hypothetical protein